MIELVVIGTPAPQGSKTPWGSEANKNTGPWRAAVAAQAAEQMNGQPLLTGEIHVWARFVFPRPKHHYRTGKHAGELKDSAPFWVTSTPDLDKLARAVGDALSGVAIRDDAQICEWHLGKLYGDPARAEIRITPALDRPSGAAKENQ